MKQNAFLKEIEACLMKQNAVLEEIEASLMKQNAFLETECIFEGNRSN